MYICSKFCLNYFKQWTQQGNSGGVKISRRSKIRRYNVGPHCSGGKSKKDKWGNNNHGSNNKENNKNGCGDDSNNNKSSDIRENDNKGKRGGGGREMGL